MVHMHLFSMKMSKSSRCRAAGVKAINLKEDDYVASGKPLNADKDQLILVTQRGGKTPKSIRN